MILKPSPFLLCQVFPRPKRSLTTAFFSWMVFLPACYCFGGRDRCTDPERPSNYQSFVMLLDQSGREHNPVECGSSMAICRNAASHGVPASMLFHLSLTSLEAYQTTPGLSLLLFITLWKTVGTCATAGFFSVGTRISFQ